MSPPITTRDDTAAIVWPLRARRRLAASRSVRRPTVASVPVTAGMLAMRAAAESASGRWRRPDQPQDRGGDREVS